MIPGRFGCWCRRLLQLAWSPFSDPCSFLVARFHKRSCSRASSAGFLARNLEKKSTAAHRRLPSVFRKILAGSELNALPAAPRSSLGQVCLFVRIQRRLSIASCSAFRAAIWVRAELNRQPRQMTLFCVRNADLTVDFRKFFTELGRHNVYPATVIHAVTNCRRLIQIAPRVLPFFDPPSQIAHLVMTRIGSGIRSLGRLS